MKMYENLSVAEERQLERGTHDQGARSQTTGGKHLNPVAEVIKSDLVSFGYQEDNVYYKNGTTLVLPGWFRASKNWDLLAFDGNDLLAVLELKSINSSFGNNANNRSEESIGSAVDAAHAIKNELIPFRTVPPALGYVLVVKICEDSIRPVASSKIIYPMDAVFSGTSYLQRLTILCRRLLSERLYQAIWIVGVNPDSGDVVEPDSNLSYDKFLTVLKAQLDIHKA